MRKYYKIVFLLIFLPFLIYSQGKRINGYIKDESSGKALAGANIIIKNSKSGTVANQSGWFSINVIEPDTLEISYIGYYSKMVTAKEIYNINYSIAIKLSERPLLTKEVVVESDKREIKNYTQTGYIKITPQEIRYLPSVGGESDITKTMQLLPGVQTLNEGSARLNIRGGSDDQNMILIDGV
jgi:hypothetical protein